MKSSRDYLVSLIRMACILPIPKKTTTSLLTISFENKPYILFINLPLNSLPLPLEDEHVRRAVHTTKTKDESI